MDVGDQGGALLLHGGEPRRLPQAIALEHLRGGNFEQAALLQGRELPGIGNRKEAFQGARCWCAALRGVSRAAAPIAGRHGTYCLALRRSLSSSILLVCPLSWGMPMMFADRLEHARLAADSLVCVGLDPDLEKIPAEVRADPQPLLAFNRRVVDATAGIAAAYKPQIAFYSALGKEAELAASIRYIRERAPAALVILDAKRGDIGNTAEAYAREAFERYGADAVTVNPYMGEDSVRPFLARPDRGALLLCRTSNPGARDFQDLLIDGEPLYRRVAARAAAHWNEHRNLMLVVGATCPAEMAELRRAHPALVVPGSRNRSAGRRSGEHACRRPQCARDGPAGQLLARHHLRRRRQERSDPRRGGGAARCASTARRRRGAA